jgi:hypothetical protein
MALDLLVITAAIISFIAAGIAFPFALITQVGDVIYVVGGAGAVVAAGATLLASVFFLLTAFGVAIPI